MYSVTAGYRADTNKHGKDGTTALIEAAFFGHDNCVQLLLDSGADVNARTTHGNTALSAAARRGHLDCVKILNGRELR